jgi:hypothetical protein
MDVHALSISVSQLQDHWFARGRKAVEDISAVSLNVAQYDCRITRQPRAQALKVSSDIVGILRFKALSHQSEGDQA